MSLRRYLHANYVDGMRRSDFENTNIIVPALLGALPNSKFVSTLPLRVRGAPHDRSVGLELHHDPPAGSE